MSEWVVDTSVLMTANDEFADLNFEATSFLCAMVYGGSTLLVDAEGKVEEEYFKRVCHQPGNFALKWWTNTMQFGRWYERNGKLTNKQKTIAESDGCDCDDVQFIGLALRSNAPVVHKDKDYGEPCCARLGVREYGIEDALAILTG